MIDPKQGPLYRPGHKLPYAKLPPKVGNGAQTHRPAMQPQYDRAFERDGGWSPIVTASDPKRPAPT
jgi:hypothetical protein